MERVHTADQAKISVTFQYARRRKHTIMGKNPFREPYVLLGDTYQSKIHPDIMYAAVDDDIFCVIACSDRARAQVTDSWSSHKSGAFAFTNESLFSTAYIPKEYSRFLVSFDTLKLYI